jgi:hypothetical protein
MRMEGIVTSFVALTPPGIWLKWQSNHGNNQAEHTVSRTELKFTMTLIVQFIRSLTFRISLIYLLTNSFFNLLPISYSLPFSPCFCISLFLPFFFHSFFSFVIPLIFLFLSGPFHLKESSSTDIRDELFGHLVRTGICWNNILQRVDARSYVNCTLVNNYINVFRTREVYSLHRK